MYPGETLWFRPDDGSDPYQIQVANAREALQRDPKHYSREKPEALVQEPKPEPKAEKPKAKKADEGSDT